MTPYRGNTILFRSSQQLPCLRLRPSKGFLSWHSALLGPSTRLVRCFRIYRDTRTPSGMPLKVRRSQYSAKYSWHISWLCICWKRTFLHLSLIMNSQHNGIEFYVSYDFLCACSHESMKLAVSPTHSGQPIICSRQRYRLQLRLCLSTNCCQKLLEIQNSYGLLINILHVKNKCYLSISFIELEYSILQALYQKYIRLKI